MPRRTALSRPLVISAAVTVADRGGLAAVSMRGVGQELGAEAMSLYHHVASKDDLLDALADWIFEQIRLPVTGEAWRPAMERRAGSAREVLAEHPWALGLIESRATPGPALLHHHDSVLGSLRGNGFSVHLASHAFSVIDAYVYGLVLTEISLPFTADSDAEAFSTGLELRTDLYPHLTEMMSELVLGGGYDFADEFEYGLAIILDELQRRWEHASEHPGLPA